MTREDFGVVGCSTGSSAGFAPYPLPERLFLAVRWLSCASVEYIVISSSQSSKPGKVHYVSFRHGSIYVRYRHGTC
jgi:hypothetical protein